MKLLALFIIMFIQIKLNNAFNNQIVDAVFGLKEYVLDLSDVDISKYCNSTKKICIWKCCPTGQIMERFKTCINSNKTLVNISVYDQQYTPVNKQLENIFDIIPGLMKDQIFARNSLWWYQGHLIEDGRLFLKIPNTYNRWKEIQINHFCVEMKLNGPELKPVFMAEYEIERFREPSNYKKWALIVSIICLVLMLLVYVVVPQLRNENGVLLVILLCGLIAAFITNCILESYNTMKLRMSDILIITFFYYFFKICTFCWTNVAFYRLLQLSRETSKSKSFVKELISYCPYAFGLPIFMTIVVATIELSDMSDMPAFVTPQIQKRGNFSFNEMESLYYLYIPILLLLTFNWLVCFINIIQFCKNSRQSMVVSVEPETFSEDNYLNRPMQFVKLLVVLTSFILLDMITVIYPKGTHDVAATFTMCMGLIIMVIFIWNQKVRVLLTERLKSCKANTSLSNNLLAYFHKK